MPKAYGCSTVRLYYRTTELPYFRMSFRLSVPVCLCGGVSGMSDIPAKIETPKQVSMFSDPSDAKPTCARHHDGRSSAAKTSLIALGLLLVVMGIYAQVGRHAFIDFDDSEYVYENARVRAGLTLGGVSWAFTTTHAANWHPLTWLSHMADMQMFGITAGWHHLMNVLIHALNGVLLFLVLRCMTGAVWRSAFVAALFAVHPLHVESVAWVAERKDVLSTFFWLLTMSLYARYVQRPGVWRYLGFTLSFVLGLLSKPMLVTLPFVLLLLDYWPLGRLASGEFPVAVSAPLSWEKIRHLALEKTFLLVLAAGSSLVTYLAQASKEATAPLEHFPLGERISNALVSYVLYLVKTVWPTSLAVFYPHPSSIGAHIPVWQAIAAAAALAALTLLVLACGRSRPYLSVGWLWYLGTLVPVIGIIQVGSQAMADRYTYVPLIGVFIAVSWGVPELLGRWRFRQPVLAALGTAVILGLSLAAWIQTTHWRDGASLYTHAIAVKQRNWLAWNNLGIFQLNHQDFRQSLASFRESRRIKPDYADAWYNEGVAFGRLEEYARAIASYREALRLDPTNADGWVNQGFAHQAIGQLSQAVTCYESALRLRPEDPLALRNLVTAYALQGDGGRALQAFQRLRAVDRAGAEELLRLLGMPR
jgi:protein O-mannosyl-transferase